MGKIDAKRSVKRGVPVLLRNLIEGAASTHSLIQLTLHIHLHLQQSKKNWVKMFKRPFMK